MTLYGTQGRTWYRLIYENAPVLFVFKNINDLIYQ